MNFHQHLVHTFILEIIRRRSLAKKFQQYLPQFGRERISPKVLAVRPKEYFLIKFPIIFFKKVEYIYTDISRAIVMFKLIWSYIYKYNVFRLVIECYLKQIYRHHIHIQICYSSVIRMYFIIVITIFICLQNLNSYHSCQRAVCDLKQWKLIPGYHDQYLVTRNTHTRKMNARL